MKIKWKPLFSLFFHVGSTIPWWRAKEILRANSGRLFLDRPKISPSLKTQNRTKNFCEYSKDSKDSKMPKHQDPTGYL